MSGDIPGSFRVRAHRGWSQCIAARAQTTSLARKAALRGKAGQAGSPATAPAWMGAGLAGAGAAGLLVIAGCAGGGAAVQGPAARVTIVSGNLTFSSAAAGARGAAAPAAGAVGHRAGSAVVAGQKGPGTHAAASGSISRTGAAQAASGRSRASGGVVAPVDLRPDLGVQVAVRDGRLTGVSVRTVRRPGPCRRPCPVVRPGLPQLAHALGAGAVADLPGHRDGRRCPRPAYRHGQHLPHAAAPPDVHRRHDPRRRPDGRRGHAHHDQFQPAHHRPGHGGARAADLVEQAGHRGLVLGEQQERVVPAPALLAGAHPRALHRAPGRPAGRAGRLRPVRPDPALPGR